MARENGGERHPRLSLFVRTQLPVAVSLAILRLLMVLFGVPIESRALVAAGAITVGVVTVAALVLPWERWPQRAQAVPACVDLVALIAVAVAMYGELDTVGVLAAFPAIWLAVAAGWSGVALGVAGAFAASLVPVLTRPAQTDARAWATALAVAGVLSVVVVAARILTARYERVASLAVAEARRREAASAESERIATMLQSFADGVDLGLLYLDENGDPVIYNQPLVQFGELARYSAAKGHAVRMWAADQVTPLAPDDQPLARVRRGEALDGDVHWVGPRGAQRAVLTNGRQVHRPDGVFAGSMIIMQDITDVVRSHRAREDALATLAHELRTPLTSIVGYTDLLELSELPPSAEAHVRVIARNAEQLRTLTSVFLDGLHRDAVVERELLGLRELVEHTVDVLLMAPGFAERELLVDVDPDLAVAGDREGLIAVLTNLLGNAVKFSRAGSRIEICGGADDTHVSLTVHNTGSRIDPADLERIFDRFYRGGNAQRDAIAGTGIGLSVSRDIVRAHGGTLTADDVATGASFTICLPCD